VAEEGYKASNYIAASIGEVISYPLQKLRLDLINININFRLNLDKSMLYIDEL